MSDKQNPPHQARILNFLPDKGDLVRDGFDLTAPLFRNADFNERDWCAGNLENGVCTRCGREE